MLGLREGEAREGTELRDISLCQHPSLDTAQTSAPRGCEPRMLEALQCLPV